MQCPAPSPPPLQWRKRSFTSHPEVQDSKMFHILSLVQINSKQKISPSLCFLILIFFHGSTEEKIDPEISIHGHHSPDQLSKGSLCSLIPWMETPAGLHMLRHPKSQRKLSVPLKHPCCPQFLQLFQPLSKVPLHSIRNEEERPFFLPKMPSQSGEVWPSLNMDATGKQILKENPRVCLYTKPLLQPQQPGRWCTTSRSGPWFIWGHEMCMLICCSYHSFSRNSENMEEERVSRSMVTGILLKMCIRCG